jgi:hypothetical protein
MTVNWGGSLWFWALRALALEYTLITLFHVGVPEIVLGLTWAGLLVFSFVVFTGQNHPA